jgi:methyl-accepting chemotaxis protein
MKQPVAPTNKRQVVKHKKLSALTPLEIDRLCAGGETRNVDFKQNAKLDGEDIVAMANGGGGVFLLGVDEITINGFQKGKVVGVGIRPGYDAIRLAVINSCKQCMPSIQPRFQKVRHPEGLVVAVFIDKPDTVTCTSGGTYAVRLEGGRQALDPERLKHIFIEQEAEAFLVRFRTVSAEILNKLGELGKEVEENISSLHKAVEPLQETADELKSDTEEIKQYTDDIISHVEEAGSFAEQASTAVENVEAEVSDISRAIQSMPEPQCHFRPSEACGYDSRQLDEAVEHLGGHLEQIEHRLEEVLGNPSPYSLSGVAESIQETVESIKGSLDDDNASAVLERIEESLERDLEGTSEALGNIQESLKEVLEETSGALGKIQESLERDLEGNSDALEKIQESIDHLEKRLNNLTGERRDKQRGKQKRK